MTLFTVRATNRAILPVLWRTPKQRAGLRTDQPMETAKALTPEGRVIAAKAEDKAATLTVVPGARDNDGKGRDGGRPRGGGRGR